MIVKAHHHAHNLGQPSSDPADFTDDLVTFITGTAGRDLLGNSANVTPELSTANVDANDAAFVPTFPYLAPGN
jgi:hypothetical protein